jgi:hypothetical protein
MRYALLGYGPPDGVDGLDDDDRAAWLADNAAFNKMLSDKGCIVWGVALANPSTATTVRVGEEGDAALTDGPFAETSEVLGGILVIDVSDLDEALAVARACPAARVGPLEVRPILDQE